MPKWKIPTLDEARNAVQQGDDDIALSLYIVCLETLSHIMEKTPHQRENRALFLDVWDEVLNIYPRPSLFSVPDHIESEKEQVSLSSQVLAFSVLKASVVDYFFEQEWKIQCAEKFGGEKPLDMSWKAFYLNNEMELVQQKSQGTDIQWAIEHGHYQWIAYCLDKTKRQFSSQDAHAMPHAISHHHIPIVKRFLSEGGNVDLCIDDEWSLLHYAVYSHSVEMVTLLLDFGAKIDVVDCHGFTPLQWSIYRNSDEISQALLARGANPRIEEEKTGGALLWALYTRQEDLALLLLEKGCFTDIKNVFSFSFMHLATIQGLSSVVAYLIEKGCGEESYDIFGRSALHWACQFGFLDTVKVCVQSGYNILKKDRFNITPFTLATLSNNSKLIHYLASKQGALAQ